MSPWLIGAICLIVGANLGAILLGVLAAGARADKRMPRPECSECRETTRHNVYIRKLGP